VAILAPEVLILCYISRFVSSNSIFESRPDYVLPRLKIFVECFYSHQPHNAEHVHIGHGHFLRHRNLIVSHSKPCNVCR
jgi:hypothetical protein